VIVLLEGCVVIDGGAAAVALAVVTSAARIKAIKTRGHIRKRPDAVEIAEAHKSVER
jgi:ferric-dicitrate binding protein FerR (iron transport regulator)